MGELLEAFRQVTDTSAFAGGPFVARFETEFAAFCETRHALGVGSGTDALWLSLLAFLRVATNPRAFRSPLTMAVAWEQVSTWLSVETVWTPEPTERHATVLGELLALPGVYGNLVPDAHLAALAIEHGLTLCSTDGDFARFPGLTWLNPLSA